MGRKKQALAYRKTISIRIQEQHKDVLDKNKWIKKEIDNMVRTFLDSFIQKNNTS